MVGCLGAIHSLQLLDLFKLGAKEANGSKSERRGYILTITKDARNINSAVVGLQK
jgi:hypothetical protein